MIINFKEDDPIPDLPDFPDTDSSPEIESIPIEIQ
jgi:hypothetical protein